MVAKALRAGLSAGWDSRLAEARARMAPSTLFMSWATPPARVPRLSIFWACMSWAWSWTCSLSACLRSVMMNSIPSQQMLPSSRRLGVETKDDQRIWPEGPLIRVSALKVDKVRIASDSFSSKASMSSSWIRS